MELQGPSYPATQHLIEKYYEYVLGRSAKTLDESKSTSQGNNNTNGTVTTDSKVHATGNIRQRIINNIIRHGNILNHSKADNDTQVVSTSPMCLDETDDDIVVETPSDDKPGPKNICIDIQNIHTENESDTTEDPMTFMEKFKTICYGIFVGDYEKDLLIEKIYNQKQHAMTYNEWNDAAGELDQLTDKVKWKQKIDSTLYDYQLIEDVTNKLKEARQEHDYYKLLYTIRTNWTRNLGNIGNVNLYRHSHVGTKYLIDEYMNESKLSLNALMNSDLDDNYLIGILQQTRRNIGRTALVLSGGGTFGMFHIGLLATLFELDLLPRVISGSSAGAIVASIMSVHYKEEIPGLLEHILEMEFNIFKDDYKKSESENFLIKIQRFFKNGTWFDNKHLVNTMIQFLGDLTFREAYNRTGKILNITVSPDTLFEQPRLLNNLTAPNVLIWSAVCASCSLPGIFPSSPLYEKDPKTGKRKQWSGSSSVKFVDGSVDNDLPISRLSEMFNVDHIIACQVNIHVFPFLKLSLSCVGGEIEDEFSARLKQNLTKVYNFMANEMIHILELGCEFGIAKSTLTKLRSVLSQQYSGDITILPDMNTLIRIRQLLTNPSKEFILREVTNGAKATWPKVSIIQNHCGQEFALDKAISYLKGRIIVSSSIKNPLQFTDVPIGLIKAPNDNHNINYYNPKQIGNTGAAEDSDERNNTPIDDSVNVLDDNLLETESTNSLLLLRENSHSGKFRENSLKITSTIPNNVWNENNQLFNRSSSRRKSDSGTRPRNNGKSLSFSLASPSSRILRPSKNYNKNASSSYQNIYHKSSTGHIMFPTEASSTLSCGISTKRKSPPYSKLLGDTFYIDSDSEDKDPFVRSNLSSRGTGEVKNYALRRHSADGKNINLNKSKSVYLHPQKSMSATSSPRSTMLKRKYLDINNIDTKDGISHLATNDLLKHD